MYYADRAGKHSRRRQKMTVKVNISKADRKQLAANIAEALGAELEYLGVPSCAYRAGEYTVTKDCTVETDDSNRAWLAGMLKRYGYGFTPDTTEEEPEEEMTEETAEQPEEGTELTIEMPRSFFTEEQLDNLEKMIESKESLIKKALGADSLDFDVDDEKVTFPWFSTADADEVKAYSNFISKLCQTAKDAKRVTAKDKAVESEKFAFRCFLIRLGFIGNEYKADRKILLKNLSGPAAFPNEAAAKAHLAKQKAGKEAQA